MLKIDWKTRFTNPVFIAQLVMAVLVPILAYMGITVENLTSWAALGTVLWEAVSNPYVLGLVVASVFNAVTNPTTKGVGDN